MKRRGALMFVFATICTAVSCGGQGKATPSDYSWGPFAVTIPAGWNVGHDSQWTLTITPPTTTDNRIVIADIAERQPGSVNADLAREQWARGLSAAGLPRQEVAAVEKAPGHYEMTAEGPSGGRYVLLAVHVFSGHVIFAMYQAATANDANRAAALAILDSVHASN